jgi:uncharacterized protein (TIGR02099 family)
MQRIRRRFWTLVISTAAAIVLSAAVASGLFQLAVESVPGYRAEIENYVRDVTGHPVRIGNLALTWRYYYPSLDLTEVALLDPEGESVLFAAERLRLGFGLLRLMRRDFSPTRLELHGLQLELRRDRGGRLHIHGIETDIGAADPTLADRLAGFSSFTLVRSRLNFRDERDGSRIWSFGVVQATLSQGLLGAELSAHLTLPSSVADSVRLRAAISGELLNPTDWSGRWRAQVTGLVAGPWLAPHLAPGTAVTFDDTHLSVSGELNDGQVSALDVHVKSAGAEARRAQHHAGLGALDVRALILQTEAGWTAKTTRLQVEGAAGRWPAAAPVEFSYATADGGPVLHLQAGFLRLGDLTPWLQMVREPGTLTALHGVGGDVHDLSLQLQGNGADRRYRVRTAFSGLSGSAVGRAAGFSGVSGELAADETGGRLLLQNQPLSLELPGMLSASVVSFDAVEGEVDWVRQPDGWRLRASPLQWQLLSTRGSAQLELTLPDDARASPVIALSAQFQSDDATAAKPLMPRVWGPGLIDWLDRAIVRGRAPKGTLILNGPLADFPFDKRPGTFSLDIEAEDVLLAFQPDWPPVENLSARLQFRGNSLNIESTKGTLGGSPIRKVTARFPDFGAAELLIDGRIEGQTPDFYAFLKQSPLRQQLEALLERTTAQGPAAVDVKLVIPLRRAENTRATGRVELQGVDLHYRNLHDPIRDLRGELSFGGRGLSAQQITAQWQDLPLDISMTPQTADRSRISATFHLPVRADGKGVSGLIPDWLRGQLRGASQWQAELMIGGRGETPLKLSTDLVGVEVRLPPPLGKTEAMAIPLELTLNEERRGVLRLQLDYAERFGGDLRFAPAGREWTLEAAALRLGAETAVEARDPGVRLAGVVPELDLEAWADALAGIGLGTRAVALDAADLQIGQAVWGRYTLAGTRFQWNAQPKGWRLNLSGENASGDVTWTSGDTGTVSVRLERLALDSGEPVESGDDPLDPGQWPVLNLAINRFTLGQTDFGRVALTTARVSQGQRLENLEVKGGIVALSGQGDWRRRGGKSEARFGFEATSTDIAALLKSFDYTANLDAKRAAIRGQLEWAPAAAGLEWAQAAGTVGLDFENGQLRAVEPGAGRVLGLINFYALPRRLTLNFRDVLSSGLGFDRIQGNFTLGDGDAHTDDLKIIGPSLRMDVRGRIGLADRDYDQVVQVYPDVSAGVTLGAVLLGGPVAGVLALIAQELLEKPLDQLTQLSYRITGSWDNPKVERVATATPVDRSSGPPSKN